MTKQQDKNEHIQDNKSTIVVIGAGIIGINCAIALQQRGFQVTLVDRLGPGEGCSKGNAGHFATEQVFPLAERSLFWQLPKLLLDPLGPVSLAPGHFLKALPWFLRFLCNSSNKRRQHNIEALKQLNADAIEYYLPLLKAADADHLLTRQGSLLVFEKTTLQQIEASHQAFKQQGVNVELLTRKQLLALEPNLGLQITHGLFFPDVAHSADPYELSLALARYAERLGVQILRAEVKSLRSDGDSVLLQLDSGQQIMRFQQGVIAAGAWSTVLVNALGYQLPLEAERGYSLTRANSGGLTRPVASAERKFIITPMAAGLRFAGTVEFAGLRRKPNYHRADILQHHAERMLTTVDHTDARQLPLAEKWSGYRPSLPDSLPVLGRAPNHSNVYLALGHQHLGLTQGAKTGTLMAQLINGEATDIDLAPFSLQRFQH